MIMDYSFEKVKKLYDNYGIGKDRTTGKYVVYEKRSNTVYDFDSDIANAVKFAWSWVYATTYGQSTVSPSTINSGELTPEEYKRAFNENSRLTYDTIMENVIMGLQTFGRMYRPEALKKEVKEAVPYAHAADIVDGLYDKPNRYASFEEWCRKAATSELEPGKQR